ncbi:succinylglutamate-semialdehyde dehydrogenase [Legionella dresdenensis]|uniref:N-succinylglutamate 5-semialdehyde dehydrogenase n=1 Tax=Legionella dresdenensis TaxID=450200 RepID=A0ABV8CHI8_9GAMM
MMMNRTVALNGRHYLDGKWIDGNGTPFLSKNPYDNSTLWQGTIATEIEVKTAGEAAHKALSEWSQQTLATRISYLQQFARQVELRKDDLTLLIAQETGKPLWEAVTEVNAVIGKINLSIQAHQERNAERQNPAPDAMACLRYKPHGVVAVLGAFNFPAHLSNGHIVPALIAGNTVIYKPSDLTPAVAELIMQCWHESGIPAGVINCIQGNAETGKLLLAENIQGVYFTGSYRTGLRIHQAFINKPEVILALEMGGNNPLIIDDVKDVNAAIYQTLLSAYITAGQRCTCARRIFISNSKTGDELVSRLITATEAIRVGSYTEQPEPFIGPVISHEHAKHHLKMQEGLITYGGNVVLPLKLLKENSGLLSPGIIDMTEAAYAPDEEIFAPLIQLYRYDSFEQALLQANATRYGLAAGLLSDSEERYRQFYNTIRAGLINWNRPTTGAASNLPFGGVGHSGNHRPSAYFAADYCAYPIASLEQTMLAQPAQLLPGITLE